MKMKSTIPSLLTILFTHLTPFLNAEPVDSDPVTPIADPDTPTPTANDVVHSLPAAPTCTILFNTPVCAARTMLMDQMYYVSRGSTPFEKLPMAYGDIPSTWCTDLRKGKELPDPDKDDDGDGKKNSKDDDDDGDGKKDKKDDTEVIEYNDNNCPLRSNGFVNASCPSAPRGQFWVIQDKCDLRAIEVFSNIGCKGKSYYWSLDYMRSASADVVIKDVKGGEGDGIGTDIGRPWCAGPGKDAQGTGRVVRSFRLLKGVPLPEPSGSCEGGRW